MGKFTISMAIFNSYVELPEGSSFIFPPFTLFPLVKSASLLNYQILARFKFLSGLGHQQNSDRLVYITLVQKYNPRFPSDHPQPAFIDLWYALVESSPGHPIEGDDQPFLMGKNHWFPDQTWPVTWILRDHHFEIATAGSLFFRLWCWANTTCFGVK